MDNTKALQLYPEQEHIDTLKHRIRDMIPGADKFNDSVLQAFATISLAHALDPFIGEIWIIPTKRGPRIRAGIEGHRKAAHKQSAYQLRQRPMTQEEFEQHGLQLGQIGAVSEIYRTDSRMADQAFIPTCGYGIWSPGNPKLGTMADRIPHTKTAFWVALKRSEQDALRKAFDLPFVGENNGPPPPGQGLNTSPGRNGDQPAPPRPEAAGSAAAAAADLYGDWDATPSPAREDHPPAEEQEEIIDATATVISDDQPPPPPKPKPTPVSAYFRTPEAAITWAIRQKAFNHIDHARNAYKKLRENARPKSATEMSNLWRADVAYRLEEAQAQAALALNPRA